MYNVYAFMAIAMAIMTIVTLGVAIIGRSNVLYGITLFFSGVTLTYVSVTVSDARVMWLAIIAMMGGLAILVVLVVGRLMSASADRKSEER